MGISATAIILEYVCPGLGVVAANLMFSSALKDCRDKVVAGRGLQALNVSLLKFEEDTSKYSAHLSIELSLTLCLSDVAASPFSTSQHPGPLC